MKGIFKVKNSFKRNVLEKSKEIIMHNNSLKGSEWRKWDLHVHTPFSIVNSFGDPAQNATWKAYFEDLEKLPAEIKVLGINDYLFLDGYKQVLKYKKSGGLKNIDLILPVIEFRIKEFVGHDQMKRINYHLLFADDSILKPEVIEQQFLNQLYGKAVLDETTPGITWGGIVTRDSLIDLGKAVCATIPEDKCSTLSNGYLELGFNNINFSLEAMESILESSSKQNTYLKGTFFKAIGKSEWEDYRWTGSVAAKKTIINGCHFVFCASETVEKAIEAKNRLKQQTVNNRLLHCSDAHALSTHLTCDLKIGRCFTWIKADTTFEGLRQITFEPDRIFIGEEPPIFSAVNSRPTKFIQSLSIRKVEGYDGTQGEWFDETVLTFNPELVTIIGNKGSGKSAVADVLGLIGNTPNHADFSFLTGKKFKKSNLATKFEAELTWASGQTETKNLGDDVDPNQPETIKYLPQNYFEKLCNDLNDKTFSAELEQVVFSHLSEEKKFGQKTFSDLINYKSHNINYELGVLKGEITDINQILLKLEEKAHPNHKEKVENLKKQKELEIKAHEDTIPKVVSDPSKEAGAVEQQKKKIEDIAKLNGEIERLVAEKQTYEDTRSCIVKELEDLKNFKQALLSKEKDFDTFKHLNQSIVDKYFSPWDRLITLKFEYKIIDDEIAVQTKKLDECNKFLISYEELELINDTKKKAYFENISIQFKIDSKTKNRDELKKNLDEPTRKFQAYLENKAKWDIKMKELIGDKNTSGSLKFYEDSLEYLKNSLPTAIENKRKERLEKTIEIFRKKREVVDIYQIVKDSIDEIITSNQHLLQEYKIILNAGFVISENFEKQFFSFVNQQVKGSFRGRDEGEKLLKTVLAEINPNDEQSIKNFLGKIIELLEKDQRSEVKEGEQRKYISDQVSGDQQIFFDFLFSLDYLGANYQLQLDSKNIDTLSPGEKGALLLVFYLMLDKNDIPLVIDQPEDNLDNKSVSCILVPFIKQAKQRRQIIMVTHNPNLAVVADAEQIICVNIDKKCNNRFTYYSGSIENPEINKCIVDILEGTWPAFDKRRLKYRE